MKVGDVVLQITSRGACGTSKQHAKIVRETKLYWIVEFVFKNKDGFIFNRYECKYCKSDLHATSESDWTSNTMQEIKNENA